MVIFGPLIVIVALLGKSGIIGLLQRFDARSKPAAATAGSAAASAAVKGAA